MGKVALITGASRGIGRQMARDFAAQGYGVAIGYLRHEQEALALQTPLPRWCRRFALISERSTCSSTMPALPLSGF